MPDYNIDQLGYRAFEQVVVSLAAHVFGPGVSAFGDGPDGGREATYEGPLRWSATTVGGDGVWNGYTVIQAKFHLHPASVKSNAAWLQAEITDELDRWVIALGKGTRTRAPHYLLVASNVRLSPAGVVGGIDALQRHFTSLLADRTHPVGRLGIREIRVWHADQIHTLLDGAEAVRRAFPALLTVGDVLAHVDGTHVRKPTIPAEFAELRRDYLAGLRQRLHSIDLEILAPPGEFSDHPVMSLESVFVPQSVRADLAPIELPAALRQTLVDSEQIADHELPNFVDRQQLEAARRAYHARPAEPVLDAVVSPQRQRTVLLGDPGAGKSAFARYLVLRLAAPHEDQPSQAPRLVSPPTSLALQPAPAAVEFEIVANHPVQDAEDVSTYLRRVARTCLPHNISGPTTSSNRPDDDELGWIADSWVYIRSLVREYSPAMQAMLHGAKPHAIKGDVLELRHELTPLAIRLSEPRNSAVLADVIQIVSGREYTIRWLSPAPAAHEDRSDEAPEIVPVRPAGDLSHLAGWLPVWIELRNYAAHQPQCNTILDFLNMQYVNEHFGFPKDLLDDYLRHDGRAVIVFDGLDEIFAPRTREQVSQQIEGFARRYNRVRILVTSRVLGYRRKPLADAGFEHLTLQHLDRVQIGKFTDRWSAHAYPHNSSEAGQMRQRLLTAIDKSTAIGELATNPLLLTILASATRHRELPRDRYSVLRHAVTVLVEQWDTSKLLPDDHSGTTTVIEYHDKMGLLRLAARQMNDAGAASGNHCPGPVLVENFREYLCTTLYLPADQAVLAARTMLKRFRERNGLLAHLGADVFGFIHRAFLDYLAADDIQARFRTNELTADDLVTTFVTKAGDPAWTAALLLASRMLPDAKRAALSAELINHGDTAGACEGGDTEDGYFWEEFVPTPHTSLGLSVLIQLIPTGTATTFTPHAAGITRGITRFLEECCRAESHRLSGSARAAGLVGPLLAHREWIDRRQYLSWYQTFFSHPRYHLPPTSDWFMGQTDSWKQAASLYIDLHRGDRHTLNRFTQSTDPMLCQLALERLVKSHATHPDTLEILRRHALSNTTPDSREVAVSALGEFWTAHPETLELVHGCTNDESYEVRPCAFNQLVRRWPTHAATLPRLLAAIADDPDDELRDEMVKASATVWPNDPRIVETLCARVFEDTSHSIRLDALEALIEMNTDDELLYRIVDHARGDEEEAVYVVADTAHTALAPRLDLRRAQLKPVGPTAETVAAVTVANAESLIYNADATAIIETRSDPTEFAQQLNTTCMDLLDQYSLADTDGRLYAGLPQDRSWRQVRIGIEPNCPPSATRARPSSTIGPSTEANHKICPDGRRRARATGCANRSGPRLRDSGAPATFPIDRVSTFSALFSIHDIAVFQIALRGGLLPSYSRYRSSMRSFPVPAVRSRMKSQRTIPRASNLADATRAPLSYGHAPVVLSQEFATPSATAAIR